MTFIHLHEKCMFTDSYHFVMILMLILANYCKMSFVITLNYVPTMDGDIDNHLTSQDILRE